MRAALASCDATIIAMEAARAGIELTDLTVTVVSESDNRGVLGVGDSVPPGPLSVRVRIELAADNATDDQLRELVHRAESRSAVADAIAARGRGDDRGRHPLISRSVRGASAVMRISGSPSRIG